VTCRDITEIREEINEIKEKDDQRFQMIVNTMPQMIWTTTPDGMHDWFSQRWYEQLSSFLVTFNLISAGMIILGSHKNNLAA
jgi:PAS domain-containing protein